MANLIESYEVQLAEPGCSIGTGRWGALAVLPVDISPAFPYLNAVMEDARYDHEIESIIWSSPNQSFALSSREIRVSRVQGPEDANRVIKSVVEKINQTWRERDKITPRIKERKPAPVMEIFKLLPRTNCRQCGYPTCMAYAADLSKGKTKPEQCLPLADVAVGKLRELLERG